MEGERYTSVSSVRQQIARKIKNLHDFLDERKLALNEELDELEQTFAVDNKKDEEELSKLTAYKGQTLAIFEDEEVDARNDEQLLKIESRMNELNKLIEMRKVRLQWHDGKLRKEVSSLGALELRGRTQDMEADYELMEDYVPATLRIRESTPSPTMLDDELEYSDMASVKPFEPKDPRIKKNKTLPPRIPSEYIGPIRKSFTMLDDELEYSDMASVKPFEPKDRRIKENKTLPPRIPSEYIGPIRKSSTMVEDELEYSDMASVKSIEPKDPRIKENKTLPPKIPSEYIGPIRKVLIKGPTIPPPLLPRNLEHTAKNLKQKMGNIKENLKWTRSASMGSNLGQEDELYGEVGEQKQGWQRHFQHKCESVDSTTQEGLYPTPPREDYTLISKCTMGSDPGQLLKPKNVAVSTKTGNIFVAEKGNNRVQVFTRSGDHLFSFGQRTKGLSMKQPYGVCVMNEKVYVSQTQTNCIMVFKTNGDYCMQGGQLGKSEGCFDFPAGLGTDGTSVYVCDYGNNRVQGLSNNLIFKLSFGVGKLTNPTDVAVDTSFNLVVLDRSNTVVHIFNSKGVYQRKLISVFRFQVLSNPLFIAISPRGNIILSDLLTCSVNLFNTDGQLLWSLGGVHDKDTFGEPRGVTCDTLGRLVVACNKQEGCLKIIQFSNET